MNLKRGLLAAACGLLLIAAPVVADDGRELGGYIYAGTCDEFSGRALDEIGDLETGSSAWRVIGQGEAEPATLYGEDEDIDQTIDQLTQEPHVVVIRSSDDERADVIACGEITGSVEADGSLMITLDDVDGSGFQGRARFVPQRDDDDPTEVTTGVWESTGGTPTASPGSTPGA